MYMFFECMALLALMAFAASLLFAATVVVVMVDEALAAVLRISRKAS